MSEGNEAKLVGKLLFGTADILGHLRENEVAATCVEKLIAGIRQSITNRPNGLLKSTKLDLLLPMMMELAKWKEGFTKTDKLRMKFERQGIDIYNRNNLCLPTTEIDPFPTLKRIIEMSVKSAEMIPLPPSPPCSPTKQVDSGTSLSSSLSTCSGEQQSNETPVDSPTYTSSSVFSVDEKILMSTQLSAPQLSLLTDNNEAELKKLSTSYPDAAIEIVCSNEERLFIVRATKDICQQVIDKLQLLLSTQSNIVNGTLYTFPYTTTPYVLNRLQEIAKFANCTAKLLHDGSSSCSLFINAARQWDVRKCIDNFRDFEETYRAKQKSLSTPLQVSTSSIACTVKDTIRYDRSSLLQIRKNVKCSGSSGQLQSLVKSVDINLLL